MNSHPVSRRLFITHWGIVVVHSFFFTFLILFHIPPWHQPFPSDISTSSLLMALLPFSAFAMAVYFLFSNFFADSPDVDPITKNIFPAFQGNETLRLIVLAAIVITLTAICLPSYYFGEYAGHYLRIRPLMIWICMIGFQFLALILFPQRVKIHESLSTSFSKNRDLTTLSFRFFISFILIWIFIATTKLGISGNEDYWYEAGVPILPGQIVISVIIGLLFNRIEKKLSSFFSQKIDLFLFFGIWLIAAAVWAATPAPTSYFNTRPSPPNQEVYPSSDATGYDLQSQYVLMGQKLEGGKAIDNPLYPAFLVLVHMIGGQNYAINMAFQAAVLAVLASIAYLSGKTLFGRSIGITIASMITFYGYNSIVAASLISLAGPKQMLTDFPTTIGIGLIIFTLISKNYSKELDTVSSIWHGGAIGFSFLIRPTSIILLVVAPLTSLIQEKSFARLIRIAALTFTGFILFIVPWGIRNSSLHGGAISTYLEKINLVKESRFPETKGNEFYQPANNTLEEEIDAEQQRDAQTMEYGQAVRIILNHFMHNILGSVLILPTSITFDDLHHTIKSETTVWRPFWSGNLSFTQVITLLGSLAILAVGIAKSWQKAEMIGLVPLMVFLFYQLANAIGRTSGGRYIVPVEWIILFYFAAGLIEILNLILQPMLPETALPVKKPASFQKSTWITLALVFMLGTFPVLIELPLFIHAPLLENENLSVNANLQDIFRKTGYNPQEITAFLEERKAVLLIGQAMYPRYFNHRAANRNLEGALLRANFPRLEFQLMTSRKIRVVALYQQSLVQLPNNTKVIVLGCRQDKPDYIDAIVVIVEGTAMTATREGTPLLACPLQQPVCDNNGNCN